MSEEKYTKLYFVRPCDDPREGYCVEGVHLEDGRVKWHETIYEWTTKAGHTFSQPMNRRQAGRVRDLMAEGG